MIEGNDGWKPELVSNPDISQDYDITVKVNPIFDSTTINGNGSYNMIEGNNGWKPELVSNPDPSETYDIKIQVPQTINPLETITNKRLQSETTYTISSLMSDSTNNAGITKDSTIIVDVPEPVYPEITFNTITQNNSTYTLSQITNNQSEYFSRNSVINCNITNPIKQTIRYVGFTESGSRINFTKGVSGNSYPVYAGQEVVTVNKEYGQWAVRFYGNDLGGWTYNCTGNDYIIIGNYNTDGTVRFYNTSGVKLFTIIDQTSNNQNYVIYLPENLYEFTN